MKRRGLAGILCVCLLLTGFTGCSVGNDGGSTEPGGAAGGKNGKGKYLEEAVKLPDNGKEEMVSLIADDSGSLELYANRTDETLIKKYTLSGGKDWKEEKADWLQTIPGSKLLKAIKGEDKKRYALVELKDNSMHVIKETDPSKGEEIKLPDFEDQQNKKKFYDFGTDLYVLEDGSIVLAGAEEVRVYKQEDGSLLRKFPLTRNSTDETVPMDVNGMNLLLRNENGTGFDIFQAAQKKKAASIKGKDRMEAVKAFLEDENDVFYLNSRGISHMQPEGSIAETVMDGSGMMMNSPSATIRDALKTGESEYYILYENSGGSFSLARYYYDKEAKQGADKTLTIYSLKENKTVRQALNVFKRENPGVNVIYNTGAGGDSSATKADSLRVLNTELLNKSGADVLILDGLPTESFIEKGILKDISGLIKPLTEGKTLSDNMVEPYTDKDGKIYGIPIRYGIPMLLGSDNKAEALESLDTLEAFIKANPDKTMFNLGAFQDFVKFLVNAYEQELYGEDGKLTEDKLIQCITLASTLAKQKNVTEPDLSEYSPEEIEKADISEWKLGDPMAYLKDKESLSAMEIRGLNDMMIPYTIMRDENIQPKSINSFYVPHGITGINSASKNTKLAEKFLETLLGGEVQGQELGDGFPCNQKANEKLLEAAPESSDDAQDGASVGISDGSGKMMFAAVMPLKSDVKQILKFAEGLNTPAATNQVILEMILEEAAIYHEGSETAEEAAQKIINKADTYLSE